MPKTEKGQKIMSAMTARYGDKKGKSIFYASRNKGTIKGVDSMGRFRFGMRDALAKGVPLSDAIGQGISAAAAADEAGRKKNFFKGIKDSIAKGRTASQAIGDALGGATFRR